MLERDAGLPIDLPPEPSIEEARELLQVSAKAVKRLAGVLAAGAGLMGVAILVVLAPVLGQAPLLGIMGVGLCFLAVSIAASAAFVRVGGVVVAWMLIGLAALVPALDLVGAVLILARMMDCFLAMLLLGGLAVHGTMAMGLIRRAWPIANDPNVTAKPRGFDVLK